jgi:hypothetical protein
MLDESDLAHDVIPGEPADLTLAYDVMASYPAIVFSAPSTDRNHWRAMIRSL